MPRLSTSSVITGVCAAAIVAASFGIHAQQPAAQGAAQGGARGGARGGGAGAVGFAPAFFTAADMNKDGTVTRAELMATLEKWYMDIDKAKTGSITPEQLS